MQYTSIQYFFWLFSGVEISLLKQCPGDYNRQAGIGFTIFMTCLFAALAGGFAAYRFSEGNWVATLVFGLVWGALIFSIDRSMVVTLKKDPTKAKQNFWEPFLTRMLLAGLLAFMISIPLEIEVFKGVINIQLQKDVQFAISEYDSVVKDNTGIAQVTAEQLRQEELRREAETKATAANNQIPGWLSINEQAVTFGRQEAEAQNRAARARAQKEQALAKTFRREYDQDSEQYKTYQVRRGSNWEKYIAKKAEESKFSNQAAGFRNSKNQKNREADALAAQYRKDQSAVAAVAKIKEAKHAQRADSLGKVIDQTTIKYEDSQKDLGFVRQYVAMENAAKTDSGVFFFLWVIRILFFTIEILPTIVKLKTPLGDYDRMLANHEAAFALSLTNNLNILRHKERIRYDTELSIATQVEKDRYAQEVDLNKKVLTDIADRQQDLAKRLLKEWHQQEKQKIAKNNQPITKPTPPAPAASPVPTPVHPANMLIAPPTVQGIMVNLPASFTPPTLLQENRILGKKWQLLNSLKTEFYIFHNGATVDNLLEHMVDNQTVAKGKWAFDSQDATILNIQLSNEMEHYKITDLTDWSLNLVRTDGIKKLEFSSKA